jgi:hypothetical protein
MPRSYVGKKEMAFIIAHFATLIPGMCSIYEAWSFARENCMKKKRVMYALLLPVIFFSISYSVAAQDFTAMSYDYNAASGHSSKCL